MKLSTNCRRISTFLLPLFVLRLDFRWFGRNSNAKRLGIERFLSLCFRQKLIYYKWRPFALFFASAPCALPWWHDRGPADTLTHGRYSIPTHTHVRIAAFRYTSSLHTGFRVHMFLSIYSFRDSGLTVYTWRNSHATFTLCSFLNFYSFYLLVSRTIVSF